MTPLPVRARSRGLRTALESGGQCQWSARRAWPWRRPSRPLRLHACAAHVYVRGDLERERHAAIPSRLLRATLAPPADRPSATPRRACAVACASRRFRVRIAATMIGRERNGTERNETDYVHVDRDGSRKRVLLISDNSALFGADALLVSLKFSSGFR